MSRLLPSSYVLIVQTVACFHRVCRRIRGNGDNFTLVSFGFNIGTVNRKVKTICEIFNEKNEIDMDHYSPLYCSLTL